MRQKTWWILFLVSGCAALTSKTGQFQELAVYPRVTSKTLAIVNPLTMADIATLDIVPYLESSPGNYLPISAITGNATTVGAADVLKLTQASPTIDPYRPFIIRKLKPNQKYRIFGRAYNVSNARISRDSDSYTDVLVGSNDTPGMATLPVVLEDTVFGASALVNLTVDGRYDYLKGTLYLLAGNSQVAMTQTTRINPEFSFSNLQGNTSYRLLVEAYKLGGVAASNSLTLNIANDTALATLSLALSVPYSVTTLAGVAGAVGTANGDGAAARFNQPWGGIIGIDGNLYLTDINNHTIRKITPAGSVTTFAGSPGNLGTADGLGSNARFNRPRDLALDANGNFYVADADNHVIRKITPAGLVSTVAGSPGATGNANGNGSSARLNLPLGIASDRNGNFYIADTYNHSLRKLSSTGDVTTFAGSLGVSGTADGSGTTARFNGPWNIFVVEDGTLYLADCYNHGIRKITAGGSVTTFAGKLLSRGTADGYGTQAQFYYPECIVPDGLGNLYISDCYNHTIRKVSPAGLVSTFAGTPEASGSVDGSPLSAKFQYPRGLVVDPFGRLYIVDSGNHTVRVIQ